MNRRQFIQTVSATSAALAMTGTAAWLLIEKHDEALTIDSSLALLEELDYTRVQTLGQWNLAQIFTHCAQSVEYSMIGFPEHKSTVFKSTIGALAFTAFNAKGKMTHDLSEAIPSAESLAPEQDLILAKQRFEQAMLAFTHFDGELAEHFAYGKLNKKEYERAHAMHFNNHLREVVKS